MEGLIFFSLLLFTFFESGYCELSSKFNDLMVNIRHAKKKDHANRDERFYARTLSYEYDDYLWMSSTEDTTVYDSTTDLFSPDIQETTSEDYVTRDTETTVDESFIYDVKEDVVTKFLRIVESQHELGENCTAGTDLNLGEGVVDRYAQVSDTCTCG